MPLTFLNSHIQHGNALLGTTPELMTKGIPDAAWEPIEGDDKKIASALKKRNKKAAEGQRSLATFWSAPSNAESRRSRERRSRNWSRGERHGSRGAREEGVAVGRASSAPLLIATRSSLRMHGALHSFGQSKPANLPMRRRQTNCGGSFATGRASRPYSRAQVSGTRSSSTSSFIGTCSSRRCSVTVGSTSFLGIRHGSR